MGEQRLRVTAPSDFGAAYLAELSVRFCARYPAVSLDVVLTNRVVDLVAEGFDVALRAARQMRDSSLVARKVVGMNIFLFAAPSYLARHRAPRSPADLAGHEWVVFAPLQTVRLEGPGAPAPIAPRGRVRGDDFWFVREAVRAGGGLALLPWFMAADDEATGRLVRVLPRHVLRGGSLWLVHPPARHLPRAISAFRDLVIETMRANPLASRA